jgi:hypothetical protein
MRYFSSKTILLPVFFIGLFLVLFKLSDIFYFPDSNWKMGRESKIELLASKPVIQKFKADKNDLASMEMLFGRSSLKKVNGKIHFEIMEENCANKIANDYLIPQDINSDDSNAFTFNKIADSENKTYCLNLTFEAGNSATKNPFIFINPNNSLDNIFLVNADGNELKNQSLSMRPAYKNDNVWQDMTELNKRISQYKPWFLKHYYLSFVVISFILLSILLVAILVVI